MSEAPSHFRYGIYTKEGKLIGYTDSISDEDDANALLMAKAPQMLDILERLANNDGHVGDLKQILKDAKDLYNRLNQE